MLDHHWLCRRCAKIVDELVGCWFHNANWWGICKSLSDISLKNGTFSFKHWVQKGIVKTAKTLHNVKFHWCILDCVLYYPMDRITLCHFYIHSKDSWAGVGWAGRVNWGRRWASWMQWHHLLEFIYHDNLLRDYTLSTVVDIDQDNDPEQ